MPHEPVADEAERGRSASPAAALRDLIASRSATVAICGLGYVGLPLARAVHSAGFRVLGLDVDAAKVEQLNDGRSYIRHIASGDIEEMVQSGRFVAHAGFETIAAADVVVICVPTPLTRHRDPDLSFVEATSREIGRYVRPGQMVILESTTYPGTTTDVVAPLLESTGLCCGRDIFLAFSPEREDPGNADFDTVTVPKVVGGLGPGSLDLACQFYSAFIKRVVPVSSPSTAEAVKLTENIFRAVNIALVNELKIIFSEMDIDIWEVIDAAKTKPFGFMPFYPGPGLGGHCIPIDPFYLTWKAREFDISTRFIELAGEINSRMPQYVVGRLAAELDQRFQKGLRGTDILVAGLAYKKNVDDMRESPSLKLIELLEARGARVSFSDPYIRTIGPNREHAEYAGRQSVDLTAESLAGFDVVLIATDHDNVDYAMLTEHSKLVIDTRNACERHGVVSDKIAKA